MQRISSRGQPTKGGSLAWGVRRGLTTPYRIKNKIVTKIQNELRTWTDPYDERSKRRNMELRFNTLDIRSYTAGSLMKPSKQLPKYELDLVGGQMGE
jgi:hypothetical protein